jgi:hypothetical protein
VTARTVADEIRQVVGFPMALNTEGPKRLDVVDIKLFTKFIRGNTATLAHLVTLASGPLCWSPRGTVIRLITAAPRRTVFAAKPLGAVDGFTVFRAALAALAGAGFDAKLVTADGALYKHRIACPLRTAKLAPCDGMGFASPMDRLPVSPAAARAEAAISPGGLDLKLLAALFAVGKVSGGLPPLDVRDVGLALTGIRAVLARPAFVVLKLLAASGTHGLGLFRWV